MPLFNARNSKDACSHPQLLALLNNMQYAYLKNPLLDTEVLLLNLTEYFNFFDTKVIPDYRLLDNFPDHISFHPCNYSSFNSHKSYLKSLDYLYFKASSSFSTFIVITDVSAALPRNIQTVSANF